MRTAPGEREDLERVEEEGRNSTTNTLYPIPTLYPLPYTLYPIP